MSVHSPLEGPADASIDPARRRAGHARSLARLRLTLLLLLSDALGLAAGFVVAAQLRFDADGLDRGLAVAAALIPFYCAFGLLNGSFEHRRFSRRSMGADRAVFALALSTALVITFLFAVQASAAISRAVLVGGALAAAVLIVATRFVLRTRTRRWRRQASGTFLRIDHGAARLERGLPGEQDLALFGVAEALDDPFERHRLGRVARRVDRIIVSCPADERARWAAVLRGCNVAGEIELAELDTLGGLALGRHRGVTTLRVSAGPLSMRDRALKRGFDLAVGGLLLVLAAPVMLVAALAIRLEGAGPILFVQRRLGRDNCLIRIYKFRSMRAADGDGDGVRSTGRDDARVTRVGRIIRRLSVDELPQLLNVLDGSMSLVGPRPHAIASTAEGRLFWNIDARYWQRHTLKPGLTGLAQVRGFRGATERSSDLSDRLQADLEYLARWSLWLDVTILARTIGVVVHERAF